MGRKRKREKKRISSHLKITPNDYNNNVILNNRYFNINVE